MASKLADVQVDKGALIMNFEKNTLKTAEASRTLEWYESRHALLNNYWGTFVTNHDQLVMSKKELEDHNYFKESVFSAVEEAFCLASAFVSREVKRLQKIDNGVNVQDSESVNENNVISIIPGMVQSKNSVPKLSLPKFSGLQSEWESFKNLFASIVVNNANIPAVEKLQHLLNCLTGDAADSMVGTTLTPTNFQVAWDKLLRRHDNKKVRLHCHLNNLLNLPSVTHKSADELKKLLDVAEGSIKGLKDLNCDAEQYDIWLVHLVSEKLDCDTRESWEISQENKIDFPKYSELTAFLEGRIISLERAHVDMSKREDSGNPKVEKKLKSLCHATTADGGKPGTSQNNIHGNQSKNQKKKLSCPFCNKNHWGSSCPQLRALSVSKRRELVKRQKLCINCFSKDHEMTACPVSGRCFLCSGKHFTILHVDNNSNSGIPKQNINVHSAITESPSGKSPSNNSESNSDDKSVTCCHSMNNIIHKSIVLATAQIILCTKSGQRISVRALIDPCSENSFVTKEVANLLNTPKFPCDTEMIGVGGGISGKGGSYTHLVLKSHSSPDFRLEFAAIVLGNLTSVLPSRAIKLDGDLSYVKDLHLADPEFLKSRSIDCLLGGDIYAHILLDGVKHGPANRSVAQRTRLGWIITGCVKSSLNCYFTHPASNLVDQNDCTIASALKMFWEIDKPPETHILTQDEIDCEAHFINNCKRLNNGRYSLRLPFKKAPHFVDSEKIALACWYRTERRFKREPDLKAAYDGFMSEYLRLGHMELVPTGEIRNENVYYIPHHAVFRPGEPPKIRVVFNASQKDMCGVSLNDTLYIGNKLQADILAVMTRWRTFKYVFTTDIVKMFRQILIDPLDRDWLRILYRFGEKVETFRLTTVTYGTSCAPFQALRVIKQIVLDECSHLPAISNLLTKQTYVDDIFGGANSLEELIKIKKELIGVFRSAGIDLDKWSANCEGILSDSVNLSVIDAKSVKLTEAVSTLGLNWDPKKDEFFVVVNQLSGSNNITKRIILSESSKLYDPLGWLAPVLILPKILMQDIWINGFDWDTELSGEFAERWLTIRQELIDLSHIRVPRHFGDSGDSEWTLHGFSDASKRAYSACLYFVPKQGIPRLIVAKSRVAPVKTVSIPRLELMGAVLLADLIAWIYPSFVLPPSRVHCWCDSRNVLCWLDSVPARWGVFVANRVSKILTELPDVRWKYVPSEDNPADCATRGISSMKLKHFRLWWAGPDWLNNPEIWPKEITKSIKIDEPVICNLSTDHVLLENNWLEKFSNYSRLIRVVAYCRRWLLFIGIKTRKCRPKLEKYLTSSELREAKYSVIRFDQSFYFAREIERLRIGKPVHRSSPIIRLNPIMDQNRLLRVGGRLSNCDFLSYEEKHPLILSKHSHLTRIIVNHAHLATLHGSPLLVSSYIFRRIWIVQGKRLIRKLVNACPKCLRYSGRTMSQQMASLPPVRITPSRPFSSTGLDYAGPIKIRTTKGRGHKSGKGWIAIFVCLVTKSVHIEIVSDLTSETFLAAFTRFSSRRGLPKCIFSDNGTTFQGAKNEIDGLFNLQSEFLANVIPYIEEKGVKWSFIPPYAPHFGGLWEAAVKSFKYHFLRVVGSTTLTFEEMSTLAAQIESCLNSRPLCAISSDDKDTMPITPGHFLIGDELLALPGDSELEDLDMTYSTRWKLISAMKNNFWSTWRMEVLHQLSQRNKWFFSNKTLEIGDLVIIKEEQAPPNCWPMARVIEVFPGTDGLTRVVKLKTATSLIKRPIDRLIFLPLDVHVLEYLSTLSKQN